MRLGIGINQQSGFGLVEVLLTAAMMSLLALGSVSIFVNGVKGQNRLEAMANASSLSSEVQLILSNSVTCINSIGNSQTFNLNASRTADGHPFRLALSNSDVVNNGAHLTNFGLDVDSLALRDGLAAGTDGSGNNLYIARLEMQVSAQKEVTGGKKFAKKPLGMIRLAVNGANNIIGCAPVDGTMADCSFNTASLTQNGNSGSSGSGNGNSNNSHNNGVGNDDNIHGNTNSGGSTGGTSSGSQNTIHHGEVFSSGCSNYVCVAGVMVQSGASTCNGNNGNGNGNGGPGSVN